MFLRYKKRILVVLLGDLFCFYISLFLALFIRYGYNFVKISYFNSLIHFSVVFLIWILLFTISRLYEFPYLENKKEFYFLALKLFLVGSIFSTILFFIFTPRFIPKLVLILTIFFSLILLFIWRTFVNWLLKERKRKVIIISKAKEVEEVEEFIKNHPAFGLEIIGVFKEFNYPIIEEKLKEVNKSKIIYLIVDEKDFKEVKEGVKNLNRKLSFLKFEEFYERLTGKVALSLIDEEWFEKIYFRKNYKIYDFLKRTSDFIGGIILFIVSLPLWPIISILIKIDSKGPVLYKSKRIGKSEKEFLIYKFRTMIKDASKVGPSWTLKNDKRITRIGKILRYTHLDEVPQVLNIIKGDTSFVGPRPEEKDLVELFKKEIPFYKYRMLIKPGIIGWAQINYSHGASIEDAIEKLKYDFYYLKYRSLSFDFLIAIKAWRIPFEIKTH